MDDQPNQDADPHKCEQEGDRGDEHAPPRAVGDGGADQESKPRQLQQDQQDDDDQAGKGQQKQRSGSGHTLLNHSERFRYKGIRFGKVNGKRERGHDLSLQRRSKLDKASRPAIPSAA